MAKRRKKLYPCANEIYKYMRTTVTEETEPDFVGNAPNYDKFKGWTPEEVLVWLNID